jgi:predicted 3-demethylubiquinone-9 3-methyltransferase (glyoxalase superfamily)
MPTAARVGRFSPCRECPNRFSREMQKITPFLWFDDYLERALKFYTSIFKRSKIISIERFGGAETGQKGKVITATFEIEGQQFMALQGGPMFKFSPAVSFFVSCETQREVDCLWRRLSTGGRKQQCGWLQDKFGISWQIIPTALGELMGDPDPEKSGRVMQAMLRMTKIDIKKLQRAHRGC